MPSLFKEIFQLVFRRFVKEKGRFPTPAERDALQDVALKEVRKQSEMADPNRLDTVIDKLNKGVPLNPSDQYDTSEGVLDAFRGFEPKVIQGGKAAETEAEMLARMKKQNKEAVARLKKKKEKDLAERLKDFDGDPDAMAMGGRAGYSGGGILKILKMLQGKVGKKNITTADKIDRPESAKLRDEFKAFNKRNRQLTDEDIKEYELELGDAETWYESGMTVADAEKLVANRKAYEAQMLIDYKAGRLDPKPGEPGRREYLERKLQEAQMSGDRRLIDPDELDELTDFEFRERVFNAQGGRIGFSGGGGAGLPAVTGGDMVYSSGVSIPGAPNIPMGEFETGIGPILLGIYGRGGYSDNPIAPDFPVDVATTEQQYGIATQIPIGDTGFTIGANYDKSRVNQRFTGDLIPNQVFKSVPVDDDQFNVGINFKKSFQEGGPVDPDRRTFIKILGGLASIPILGKFVAPFKQAAPVVAETAKEVPAYFFKLVDKIRRLGDDAPGLTTVERESGKKYKNYEMVEDQTTGDIVIKKQKEGGAMYGDEFETGIVQEEVLAYRTPKNTPEGRLPADYEEITVRPDFEGKMRDVEDGLDSMNEILEEVGEAQLKKAGGGLAYMLGE